MKGIFPAVCIAALSGFAAGTVPWFDENYAGLTETSDVRWDTAAGTWRRNDAADRTVWSPSLKRFAVDTGGGELGFTAKTAAPADAVVKVTVKMKTAACAYEDGLFDAFEADRPSRAGFALKLRQDGTVTFVGLASTRDATYVRGRWVELSAPGVTAAEDVEYAVGIERDFGCVPTRVRYSVNGVVLKDATGAEWFSLRSPLDPAKLAPKRPAAGGAVPTVEFIGVGTVGEITSETISKPTPRAKVDFAAVSRPVAGSELSFAVTPNAGAAVGDTLTTRWYRADAAGREVPGTSRTGGLTYALSAADFGHWIAVDVSDESGYVGTGRFWASDLPVVYLTAGEEGAWEWPTGMKEDHTGWIRIVGNAEYPDQCDCAVKFHVRGNSTAWEDKKPYKLKLDKKADLFGLGGGVANKHWNLLANVYDESLMRNKLSYDLSAEFGAPVAMRSEWVDVVMNGQYVGNYQLCQHVRISEERVNVYDWSKAMEKIAEAAREANPALSEDDQDEIESLLETDCRWMTTGEFTYLSTNYTVKAKGTPGVDGDGHVTVVWKKFTTDISGGYLFEIDHRSVLMQPEPSCFAQTNRTDKGNLLMCVIANEPEYAFTNPDVRDFCWNAWEQLSLAWLDERGQSPDGHHYRELADFDSMVAYWLSMYVPGNNDASFLSRFAYLDQGGKMTFGPAWDFDYGLGSLQIRNTFGTVTNENGSVSYAPIQPERWIPGSGWENFMAQWTSDPYFTYCLRERYRATRAYLAEMVKSGGLIDRYAAKLANSARANDLRWNNRIGFSADVDALRDFLTRRFAWLDGKFATVGNALVDVGDTVLSASLKYRRSAALAATLAGATNIAESVETALADVGCLAWREPVTGTVSVPAGATALEVSVNGRPLMTVPVQNGAAALSIPVAALTLRARNFIGLDAVDDRGAFVARNAVLLTCDSPAPFTILLK